MQLPLIITLLVLFSLIYFIYVTFSKSENKLADRIKSKRHFILLTAINFVVAVIAGYIETSLVEPSAMWTAIVLLFTSMSVISFVAYIQLNQSI